MRYREDSTVHEGRIYKKLQEKKESTREEKYQTGREHALCLQECRETAEVRKNIKRVFKDCKVCKKFRKSLRRPKVTLPKMMDFNEIVSLDC